ncbi:hypothetical protein Xen7305DRAFT_00051480 [Xenococcus sp. PCC 7305]|uniref:hypothetical protein n=1 Tax=Xenococcus sp. PCC 7305 TaxID=102125 RepID=UPI0002AC192D|nr:hypothetical protein [Xenococcus sp. PCC 7305]ELS05404.1 hypothetical protein Xen7305DRAFT_00051480 [Xenococcus sp. PCC 7305]
MSISTTSILTNTEAQALRDVDDILLPHQINNVLSMLTHKEKKHLYKIASIYFKNEGLMFDAGLFFGASTLCFGKGLQNNPNFKIVTPKIKPIQSFEMGTCTSYSANLINELYPDLLEIRAGDNFLPFLRKNIQSVNSLSHLHEGDIVTKMQYLPDYTYEVVFLDVLKNSDINDAVIKKVFPQMIPGRTILIQQDFVHEWLPFIHVSMGYLKDYFELLFTCSASAFYLNIKPVPKDILNCSFYQDFEPDELLKFFDLSIDPQFNEAEKYRIDLAKSVLITQKFGKLEALDFLQKCQENYQILSEKGKKIPLVDTHINWVKNYKS